MSELTQVRKDLESALAKLRGDSPGDLEMGMAVPWAIMVQLIPVIIDALIKVINAIEARELDSHNETLDGVGPFPDTDGTPE